MFKIGEIVKHELLSLKRNKYPIPIILENMKYYHLYHSFLLKYNKGDLMSYYRNSKKFSSFFKNELRNGLIHIPRKDMILYDYVIKNNICYEPINLINYKTESFVKPLEKYEYEPVLITNYKTNHFNDFCKYHKSFLEDQIKKDNLKFRSRFWFFNIDPITPQEINLNYILMNTLDPYPLSERN